MPVAGQNYVEIMCQIVLQAQSKILVEAGSPFREPLLKYLLRYPQRTIEFFTRDTSLKDKSRNRYLEYIIKHEEGKPFREILQENSQRLIEMTKTQPSNSDGNLNYGSFCMKNLNYLE